MTSLNDEIMIILSDEQKFRIWLLLAVSVVLIAIPLIVWLTRRIISLLHAQKLRPADNKTILTFSIFLISAVWCLRFAVGLYSCYMQTNKLTIPEEIFNSIAHAIQTFSMDEDYTDYIVQGKAMLEAIAANGVKWAEIYGIYASVLNFIAPIAGGAILLEILASIFPKLRLWFVYFNIWREKYYFSELNERSLALATSILYNRRHRFFKPIVIFTDTYVDDEQERDAEMLAEAKSIGAICTSEDITHIRKNRFGKRKFFLIDTDEIGNLHTLSHLADKENYKFLKKAEVCIFTQSEMHIKISQSVKDRLLNEYEFEESELPIFIPVHSYRNLVSDLLVDLPLYEPLIGKKRNADGTLDLNVTIIGTGSAGTEMFLATYWFGQILDCHLTINVISRESETTFWGRIDSINPEIKRTVTAGDPILLYNRKGDHSTPYAEVRYFECEIDSSEFVGLMSNKSTRSSLPETDYFFIALGSDKLNVETAETVRRHIGEYHVSTDEDKKTIITYIVYDSDFCEVLNRKTHHCSDTVTPDVYMRAIGGLDEVFSERNVFMTDYEQGAQKANDNYDSIKNRHKRAEVHKKRMIDDYKHWSSRAQKMHVKYKAFSAGCVNTSVFMTEGGNTDPKYIEAANKSLEAYRAFASGLVPLDTEEAREAHFTMLHRLAWLEHRRWNAFTRIRGFRQSDKYEHYYAATGSYKHMDLKLHPCLVECDEKGVRGTINEKGETDPESTFKVTDPDELDLLDELSYDLLRLGYNDFDFKIYDYPNPNF